MNGFLVGLIWAFSFVLLEAIQAVYFGGVFQAYSSFLIGAYVFGLSALGTLIWTHRVAPEQLWLAWTNRTSLFGLNLSTTIVWGAYFFALQMIEPAIVFAVFSGIVPLTIVVASRIGVPEASSMRSQLEKIGLSIVVLGLLYLGAITLFGYSGFVRGGVIVAFGGVALSCVAAMSLAAMMIFSQRLDRIGLAPVAQYGLRFPMYLIVAILAVWLGIDSKTQGVSFDLVWVVLIGFAVIGFPVFAMQKAISLMATLPLALITALGPFFVFLFQFLEGRVDYSSATITGLVIYFVGSALAAFGGLKSQGA